jgi:pimeloyl-ACP methyl ester carboxylesterase
LEQTIQFSSDGLALQGVMHVPEGGPGPFPAIILCHGFGGSCHGAGHPELARTLEHAGYAALRFDFRGCGKSEGERGSVICEEEVDDLRNAIKFLQTQPGIDRAGIGLVGASLGGSLAIQVAATTPQIKLCVAIGAIGNGERRFRRQYPDAAQWQAFLNRVREAKRDKTLINRFDIIQIPERDRTGLPLGAVMEFTPDTALSLLDFNPESVVAQIAPRPLLLLHARGDGVIPVAETNGIARAAGAHCESRIIESHEHFASGSPALAQVLLDWLKRHMQAQA